MAATVCIDKVIMLSLAPPQVMHSDIKARNVLLSGNRDVAKISDVGVAKFLNEMATQTQSAYVAWTFAYAAPEILMNQKSGAQVPPQHQEPQVTVWPMCTVGVASCLPPWCQRLC